MWPYSFGRTAWAGSCRRLILATLDLREHRLSKTHNDTSRVVRRTSSTALGGVIKQLGRYAIVGLLVAATDYSLYLLLIHVGLVPVAANAGSRIPATCVGALLHRSFTFSGPQRWSWGRQMMAYGALSAFNLLLSSALIFLLHDWFEWAPLRAKLGTDVLVILLSWLIGRFVIFVPAGGSGSIGR